MSEKRVYQEKMLNSKKEIVICNWERGQGKTHSIFTKIVRHGVGKYIYISSFEPVMLKNEIKEYVRNLSNYIKTSKFSKDEIIIEFTNSDFINGGFIEIYFLKPSADFRGKRNMDIAFFDECYPDKLYIDGVLKPMGVKQIYTMFTNDSIEYIDSRNSVKVENFYSNQIEELMIEYSNIPKNEKTTITREKILQQIKILQDMQKNNLLK